MKALILSGGGARGAYEAGVAMALLAREDFDIVCGASIGAVNGALVAQDDLGELERIWRTIAAQRALRLAPEIQSVVKVVSDLERLSKSAISQRPGLLVNLFRDYAAMSSREELTSLLGALTPGPITQMLEPRLHLVRLRRTLIISATNITHGRAEAFYNFTGLNADDHAAHFRQFEPHSHRLTEPTYLAAVCASSAVPGAFPPVDIVAADGSHGQYVDGGITANTPVRQAIDAGASDVTVVYMDRADLRPPNQRLKSIADVGLAVQDIRQQRLLEIDLRFTKSVNKAVLAGHAPGKRYVSIRTISPQKPLGLSVMEFDDQALIDNAIEQGKRDGEQAAARAS